MKKLGNRRSKWKVQRALGVELPGLGRPGALERRPFPPGQHGPDGRRRKRTNFALQLREKQKLLFHYVIREEQLRRFVRNAKTGQGSNWIGSLLSDLERRLDSLVFRAGYARSIPAARQLVRHGHVLVNGKRANIGSMLIPLGARIELTQKGSRMSSVLASLASPRLPMPAFLEYAGPREFMESAIILCSVPESNDVPFELNASLIAEYYASRGV
jgi:small subunit ribosomal protein S4